MSLAEKAPLLPTVVLSSRPSQERPQKQQHKQRKQQRQASTTSSASYGYALMFLSAVFQAVATLFFHMAEVQYRLPVASNLFVLGAFSALLPLLVLTLRRTFVSRHASSSTLPVLASASSSAENRRMPLVPLALRALFGGLASLFSTLAVSYISAGMFSTLYGLSPAMTTFLAASLFAAPFTPADGLSLLVNLAGVALVSYTPSSPTSASVAGAVAPSLPHSSESSIAAAASVAAAASSNTTASAGVLLSDTNFGILCGILAALCAAGSALSIKRMGKTVNADVVTASFGLGCLAVTPLIARPSDFAQLIDGNNTSGALCAVVASVSMFLSQVLFTNSLKHAPAGPAVLVRSLSVPLVFILALATMGERISATGVIGIALTVSSLVPLLLRERTVAQKQKSEQQQPVQQQQRNCIITISEHSNSGTQQQPVQNVQPAPQRQLLLHHEQPQQQHYIQVQQCVTTYGSMLQN